MAVPVAGGNIYVVYRYVNVMPPLKAGGRRSAKLKRCELGAEHVGGAGRHGLRKPGRSRLLAVKYVC